MDDGFLSDDLAEVLKTTIMGGRGCGKTNMMKRMEADAIKRGYTVKEMSIKMGKVTLTPITDPYEERRAMMHFLHPEIFPKDSTAVDFLFSNERRILNGR